MKRVYHHYTKWEDFQAGMYDEVKEGREERIQKAIELLTDEKLCYQYMKRVTVEWVYACEQAFTNHFNHRAFLGQCACNLYAGVHEDETRKAWWHLTEQQRYRANEIANRVYAEWRATYEKSIGDQCV